MSDPDPTRWWPAGLDTALRDRLLASYDEPRRGYHDRTHLAEVLIRLDELCSAGIPEAIVLAAWFHDAVYDGGADDEERSAALAELELPRVGTDAETTAEVARLVRLTADHRPDDDDVAGQLLCDADLAILASGPERYADYVAGVRAEWAHVGDDDFAAGRLAVLEDLQAKPALFHTDDARRRWEQDARRNLDREISSLRT